MKNNQQNHDQELLIESYGLLRDELITRIELDESRFTRGLLGIAAVIGYGLVSTSNEWIVSLSPFILAFLYLQHIRTRNAVGGIACHLLKIEGVVEKEEPLFNWEKGFGGYFRGGTFTLFDPSWRWIPNYLMLVGAILVYIFLVMISLDTWPTNPQYFSYVHSTHLKLIFSVLFVVLVMASISHIKYLQNLSPR